MPGTTIRATLCQNVFERETKRTGHFVSFDPVLNSGFGVLTMIAKRFCPRGLAPPGSSFFV